MTYQRFKLLPKKIEKLSQLDRLELKLDSLIKMNLLIHCDLIENRYHLFRDLLEKLNETESFQKRNDENKHSEET